jgi:hypothetical protein
VKMGCYHDKERKDKYRSFEMIKTFK